MTQEKRAEINRGNAQKSTGPKSESGKKRSSMNACRHGLTGQIVVMPEEDLEAYNRHQQSFHDEHKPKGVTESQLVQVLADSTWKLNRSTAWQNQILTHKSFEHDEAEYSDEPQLNYAFAIAAAVAQCTRDLSNLSIYEQRSYRLFEKALDRLAGLQEQRKNEERRMMAEASRMLNLHEAEQLRKQEQVEEAAGKAADSGQPTPAPHVPVPYSPARDGFVFSIVDIQAFVDRKEREAAAWIEPKVRRAAA